MRALPGPRVRITEPRPYDAAAGRIFGSVQATHNGHPLYTYKGDTAPGQAKGNGLNISGGAWHEVTASGAAAPAPSQSTSSGGGYGY